MQPIKALINDVLLLYYKTEQRYYMYVHTLIYCILQSFTDATEFIN